MDDRIHILDRIVQAARAGEVVNLNKVKLRPKLGSGLHHCFSLGKGPGCSANLEATPQEFVDNMCANEARGPRDENVSPEIQISIRRRIGARWKAGIRTAARTWLRM